MRRRENTFPQLSALGIGKTVRRGFRNAAAAAFFPAKVTFGEWDSTRARDSLSRRLDVESCICRRRAQRERERERERRRHLTTLPTAAALVAVGTRCLLPSCRQRLLSGRRARDKQAMAARARRSSLNAPRCHRHPVACRSDLGDCAPDRPTDREFYVIWSAAKGAPALRR